MRAALCFLFAAPASAEWVKVSETEAMAVYIDDATIRKDKHLRRVWGVLDYAQVAGSAPAAAILTIVCTR